MRNVWLGEGDETQVQGGNVLRVWFRVGNARPFTNTQIIVIIKCPEIAFHLNGPQLLSNTEQQQRLMQLKLFFGWPQFTWLCLPLKPQMVLIMTNPQRRRQQQLILLTIAKFDVLCTANNSVGSTVEQ